ncbi:MAG TPA: hypothetical protein VNJ02_14625 [Vicinamibacterales bacterium]|nr:hypothetical protein [Vicinamibacterales bacterium]
MTTIRRLVFIPAVLAISIATGCSARPPVRSLSDLPLRVRPGHTVYVVDETGNETRGRLTTLALTSVTLDVEGIARTFDAPQIRQVQRYGDSLTNGIAIGVALSVPGWLLQGPGIGIRGTLLYAAIGAGIDRASHGREQIYLAPGQPITQRRLGVAPLITRRGGGLAFTVAY